MKKNFFKIFVLVLVLALCCSGIYFILNKNNNASIVNEKYELNRITLTRNEHNINFDVDDLANIYLSVDKNGKGTAKLTIKSSKEFSKLVNFTYTIDTNFDLQITKKSDNTKTITIPDQSITLSMSTSDEDVLTNENINISNQKFCLKNARKSFESDILPHLQLKFFS